LTKKSTHNNNNKMKKVNIKILARAGERTPDLLHHSLQRYQESTEHIECCYGIFSLKTNLKRKPNLWATLFQQILFSVMWLHAYVETVKMLICCCVHEANIGLSTLILITDKISISLSFVFVTEKNTKIKMLWIKEVNKTTDWPLSVLFRN